MYYYFETATRYAGSANYYKTTERWSLIDSMGYLVTRKGDIQFSNINFNDTLNRYNDYFNNVWEYSLSRKMEKVNTPVTVPAGTFSNILNFGGTVYVSDEYTNRYDNPRFVKRYFAKNIGIIFENAFYITTGTYLEKRLVRYHINGITYPSE